MSYKKRHIIGYGSILGIILLLLIFIIVMLNSTKVDLLEIVDDRYQKVKSVTAVQQNLLESDRALLNMVDGSGIAEGKRNIEGNHTEIERNLAYLDDQANRKQARQLLADFNVAYRDYLDVEKEIIKNVENGEVTDEQSEILLQNQVKKQTEVISIISQFKTFQEDLMTDALQRANEKYENMLQIIIASIAVCVLLTIVVYLWVIRVTTKEMNRISSVITKVDLKNTKKLPRLEVRVHDEIGKIAIAFNNMSASLEEYSQKEETFTKAITDQNWVQTRVAEIAEMYQGIFQIETLAKQFMTKIATMTDASIGAFYIRRGKGTSERFIKIGNYAGDNVSSGREEFRIGEGLIGQAVLEGRPIIIKEIPDDYQFITTGLGQVKPKTILITPVLFENDTIAVIELASINDFSVTESTLLTQTINSLGMAINSVLGRMEIERLLNESQAMTEELQVQAEELQAQAEEMQMQSEELRMINEQLEERNQESESKSNELELSKKELEEKNEQLQLSSRYKTEFLANMSHELRTPLNSILILSEMLAEDGKQNFTDEDREFAQVIHQSGNDLMTLINDILDLSKVEAGKLNMFFNEVNLFEIVDRIDSTFAQVAKRSGLSFKVEKHPNLPHIFYTDEQRLQQILKNLLSNAIKFTEEGTVQVKLQKVQPEELPFKLPQIERADYWIEVKVVDTGVGIPKDKQKIIFEAFQQADGATARKYGGTGLGLSICREFVSLLGGTLLVQSEENQGSTFTLYLPSLPDGLGNCDKEEVISIMNDETAKVEVAAQIEEPVLKIEESHAANEVFTGKKILLVDDDRRNIFALQHALESKGMHTQVAENGLECLKVLQDEPQMDMILMDIMMPEMDGYETIRQIRSNPVFTSVPIVAVTAKAMKGDREKCLEAGANDYISKPIELEQLFSVMRVWLTK